MKYLSAVAALALGLSATAAFAQNGNDANQNGANATGGLDATLTVLPQNAQVPSAVTDRIQIPQQGIDTANSARVAASAKSKGDGQSFGAETAANAQDKQDGRSFGAATAAAAQAREDSQDSEDSQDHLDGQANAEVAQELEDGARAFGDETSTAAREDHEAFSQGSRPPVPDGQTTPPDVQSLPAVQDLPAVQGPPSSPGKP